MKAPLYGTVKTRMQPQLNADQSLALYKAMGIDLLQNLSRSTAYNLEIHFSPPHGLAEMRRWLGEEHPFIVQRGDDLGEKMLHSFRDALYRGYRKIIIIGSDLPTLDAGDIEEALSCLEEQPVVLGPTDDGGYYLIGLRGDFPALFTDVEWSTTRVLEQTLHNAKQASLPVHLLKQQSDIDTYQEVKTLWQGVCDDDALRKKIPATYAALLNVFSSSRG